MEVVLSVCQILIGSFDNKVGGQAVLSVLDQLGYREGEGLALPAIAKFWDCNGLGSLTVFPRQLATVAMQDVIERERTRKWERYSRNLAFVLPETAASSKTAAKIQKYGSLHSRSIYRGGGPFILEGSPDLVPRILRKLGFLDNGLNSDLTEAMLCFLNSNTPKLRKTGLLPETGQGSSLVEAQLRHSFLSPVFSGSCRLPSERQQWIRPFLEKEGVSDGQQALSEVEIFEAMKVYAAKHGLPSMRTSNGLAVMIMRHLNKHPNRRGFFEIQR